MQTIILAAGLGTRLEPLTIEKSKVMVPVANKPFIEWTLNYLEKDVMVVVRKDQTDLIEFLDDKAEIIFQEKPLGTGDALFSCKENISGKFSVINGDCYFSKDDLKNISNYSIGGFQVDNINQFGSIVSENGIIKDIKEKSEQGNGIANAGIYSLDDEIFKILEKLEKSERGEVELTDAIKQYMQNQEMKLVELQEWKTITHPWDLLDINSFILEKEGSQISENAEIRPGAHIEDNVAIGDSVIGPNCYVRKSSSIGNNCKVGNAVEIKNSIIMDHSFISHLSYVGDSIVGRNCNIGAGTIFANLRLDEKNINAVVKDKKTDSQRKKLGGIIGDNVKFGVNVTVMPGKKIWPNIMIPSNSIVANDQKKQVDLKENLGKVI